MFAFIGKLFNKLFGSGPLEVQVIPLPMTNLSYEYLHRAVDGTWAKYTLSFDKVMSMHGQVAATVQDDFNQYYGRTVRIKVIRDQAQVKSLLRQAFKTESRSRLDH